MIIDPVPTPRLSPEPEPIIEPVVPVLDAVFAMLYSEHDCFGN